MPFRSGETVKTINTQSIDEDEFEDAIQASEPQMEMANLEPPRQMRMKHASKVPRLRMDVNDRTV